MKEENIYMKRDFYVLDLEHTCAPLSLLSYHHVDKKFKGSSFCIYRELRILPA